MNICKNCNKEYDIDEVKRVFGDVPWTWGCCSAKCYTDHQLKCQEETDKEGFICGECGNTEFYAHQVCHMDVVVNGHNDWQRNHPDDNSCCYEAKDPFGPYTCTKCKREYPDLSIRRSRLMKVQKKICKEF